MLTKYYSDHTLGEKGRTRGRTITENDLVTFASFTGDWHSLHTDREYAAKSRFGQRIAHGFLVLSVASGLIDNDPPFAAAFYSLDNVQFRQPTFIGDTIHVNWEVTSMTDHDADTGLIVYSLQVVKQDNVICARADMQMLVAKSGGIEP